MLTELTVTNFRNLKDVSLENLGRITLIAGKNGVGKTALLEALWLLSGSDMPELGTRLNAFRGLPVTSPDTIFRDLFRNFDTQRHIRMTAHGDWGSLPRELDISLQDKEMTQALRSDILEKASIERSTRPQAEGEFEIVFKYRHHNGRVHTSRAWWVQEVQEVLNPVGTSQVTVTGEGIRQERQMVTGRPTSVFMASLHRDDLQTVATRFGELQLKGKDAEILRLLCPLEPRLKRLVPITIRNATVIHANIEGSNRPIPIQLLGEGLNRMFGLALAMGTATGGLLLIDEIENGLHHTVLEEVFVTLLEMARTFDVQVFATTHSAECIRAAHEALNEVGQHESAFYRLQRINGEIKAVDFDHEMLETAIAHKMEVR